MLFGFGAVSIGRGNVVWDRFDPDIEALAVWHAAAVGVEAHQLTGDVTVADEQHSGREFVSFGGFNRYGHIADVIPHVDMIPFRETESLHVVRVDLHRICFIDVTVRVFPLVEGRPLTACATGDEDEQLWHLVLQFSWELEEVLNQSLQNGFRRCILRLLAI